MDKQLLMISKLVHKALIKRYLDRYRIIEYCTNEIANLSKQMACKGQRHKHYLALEEIDNATKIAYGIASRTNTLQRYTGDLSSALSRLKAPRDQRYIYKDLVALQQEFDVVGYDHNSRCLGVTTEPIILHGINLGPFSIELMIDALPCPDDSCCCRVVALSPNPSSCNEYVTHPHVEEETICLGQAKQAVAEALDDSRILDVFMLIAGVLRNYNSDSPFVKLENWYGEPCYNCGAICDNNSELHTCEFCEHLFCPDCIGTCGYCSASVCVNCMEYCNTCEEYYCSNCVCVCPHCERPVCTACLEGDGCVCQEESENVQQVASVQERTQGVATQDVQAASGHWTIQYRPAT